MEHIFKTTICGGDVVGDVLAGGTTLGQNRQLLVKQHLELVRCHVRDTSVGLQVLKLVQAPVHTGQSFSTKNAQHLVSSWA